MSKDFEFQTFFFKNHFNWATFCVASINFVGAWRKATKLCAAVATSSGAKVSRFEARRLATPGLVGNEGASKKDVGIGISNQLLLGDWYLLTSKDEHL